MTRSASGGPRRSVLPIRLLVGLLTGLASAWLALPASAADLQPRQSDEFADLSIEELANIEVTSVSKRPERLQDAPASVFVITADDIRRSGARSLPEVLRLAPNLNVARGSNNGYAISARGMNGSSNSAPNKLLVLVDGRSVYSPLFSGVFWDEPDVVLEDIERIEVISGPGGTLWGVNAVNGVINITTRAARDTHGDLLAGRVDEEGAQAAFRHGGGDVSGGWRRDWRIDGKLTGWKHSALASGDRIDDASEQARIGLRADWERGADRYDVSAGAWRGREGQPYPGALDVPGSDAGLDDIDMHGATIQARWERQLAGGGSLAVQASYDQRYRRAPPTFADAVDIADLQFQHALPRLGAHGVVWGGEYRYSWDHVTNGPLIAFLPASDKQAWASLFGQDEIALRPDLRLTAGVRWERNPYTGAEFLPNLRLSWRATPAHAFWAAVSRTVRAPTRLDADVYVPGVAPYLLAGGWRLRSETARVLELGYRGQVGRMLSYSVTAFHNLYDHLRTQEVINDGTMVAFSSLMEGHARGIEAWGNLQVTESWRLSAGLTALHERFDLKPGSTDTISVATTGHDPAYTAQLRSSYAFDAARELDVAVRRVGAMGSPQVPAYTALDLRLGWRLAPGTELSLVGANLNGGHGEYGPLAVRTEVPRSLGVKVVWQR